MAQLDDALNALFASGAQSLPQQAPQPQRQKLSFLQSILAAPFPRSVVDGTLAKYAAMPQEVQDEQTSRALDLQQKRAALAFMLQRRDMLGALLPQLVGQPALDASSPPADSTSGVPQLPPAQSDPNAPPPTPVSPVTVTSTRRPAGDPLAARRQALAGLAIVDDKPSDAWGILKGDFAPGVGGDLYDKTNGQMNGVRLPAPELVNDRIVDRGDHANVGQFFGKPPAPGAEPVYNARGDQIGWQTAPGVFQAIQAASKADALGKNAGEAAYAGPIAAAKEEAKAPYTPVQVSNNGVPTTVSAAQLPQLTGTPLQHVQHSPSGALPPVPIRASSAAAALPQRGAPLPSNGHAPAAASTAVPVTAPPRASGGVRGVNPVDQKRLDDLRKQADQQERVAGMADDFMKLNAGTSTGPGYDNLEVPIPFAHTHVNLNPLPLIQESTNPNFSAMEGITSRAAPLMRPEGSGRIMQQEYQKFLEAFPNVRNLGTANEKLAAQLHSESSTRRAYANFMSDWLTKNGSLTGADQAWASQQQAPQGQSSGKSYRYDPKTGSLEPVQ